MDQSLLFVRGFLVAHDSCKTQTRAQAKGSDRVDDGNSSMGILRPVCPFYFSSVTLRIGEIFLIAWERFLYLPFLAAHELFSLKKRGLISPLSNNRISANAAKIPVHPESNIFEVRYLFASLQV